MTRHAYLWGREEKCSRLLDRIEKAVGNSNSPVLKQVKPLIFDVADGLGTPGDDTH
ncbi:hypothetical protein GRAN_0178 [Granulicella sibirica]|uniref:Uncharacterized protein n=1 Tax=Granulicella sibirica TaxID=2479048 RepID=A0A4Q0T4A3_9BACT|nr:hypothetical protein [Granulicella sibirica]RXH56868.1 hypothetical protein GRAN_0178 [Granulicella sibirica]